MENNKVHIDDIDLKILYSLYQLKKNEQITTYQLAKKIFTDLENTYQITMKNNLVTSKLKRLSNYGIIEINQNEVPIRTKSFDLIANNIFIKKINMKSIGVNNNAMFLRVNGYWNAFLRDFFIKNQKV